MDDLDIISDFSEEEDEEDEEEFFVEHTTQDEDDNIISLLKDLYVGYSTKRGFPSGHEVKGWCNPWRELSDVVDTATYEHVCLDGAMCHGKIRLTESRCKDFYEAASALAEHYRSDADITKIMAHIIYYQLA